MTHHIDKPLMLTADFTNVMERWCDVGQLFRGEQQFKRKFIAKCYFSHERTNLIRYIGIQYIGAWYELASNTLNAHYYHE